jgi:hypothetical protein
MKMIPICLASHVLLFPLLCGAQTPGPSAPPPGFKAVFNGKDFEGWSGSLGNCEIKDGAIVCKDGKGGAILTNAEFSDFVVRLEFNGKDLDGWHALPGCKWFVLDGQLIGIGTKEEKRHSLLLSDKRYKNFRVRVEFMSIPAGGCPRPVIDSASDPIVQQRRLDAAGRRDVRHRAELRVILPLDVAPPEIGAVIRRV